MAPVKAVVAGKALKAIATKLLDNEILSPEGYQVLSNAGGILSKHGDAVTWTTQIPVGNPVRFARIVGKDGNALSLTLSAKGIVVNQVDERTPPFEALDIAILGTDLGEQIVYRWHLDRANTDQAGPLFHLQYGGHHPGAVERDRRSEVPRWCHPPMEIGLLCEMIAANYYTPIWQRTLRTDPGWCSAIRDLQKLCYPAYVRKLSDCLEVSHSTALGEMWNGHWT